MKTDKELRELDYRVLRILEREPDISQRALARELGISLGSANYCLQALMHVGWVKARNFKNSRNKQAYFYKLTPSGVAEKTRAARRFLEKKQREYEMLAAELELLKKETATGSCNAAAIKPTSDDVESGDARGKAPLQGSKKRAVASIGSSEAN